MLYDLYKLVYLASREDKEYLHGNWGDIVEAIKKAPKVKIRNRKQPTFPDTKLNPDKDEYEYIEQLPGSDESRSILFKKKPSIKNSEKMHDPETPGEMLRLIKTTEKFINEKNDLTYGNLSVFLNPLACGSKKLYLRPRKVVGLVRKLESLSRRFDKCGDSREKDEIVNAFKTSLSIVKERLSSTPPENKTLASKKRIDKKGHLCRMGQVDESDLEQKIIALMNTGMNRDRILQLLTTEPGEAGLSYPIETVERILSQLS